MMFKMLHECRKVKTMSCNLCSEIVNDVVSYPESCKDLFHFKCLRQYVDDKLDNNKPITCPECKKMFGRIAYRYKKSDAIVYQNVIDDNQCSICFGRFRIPVAHTDCCKHVFCHECLQRWCTFKHECPMDRLPIKIMILTDFPEGPVLKKIEPPAVEQDLNGDGDNDDIINTICEICNLGNNDDQLLLCDNCNLGYHMYCLRNPLNEIPDGDWFCDSCARNISSDSSVSFQIGPRAPRGLNNAIMRIQTRLQQENEQTNTRRQRPRRGRAANSINSSNTSSLSESEEVVPRRRSRPTRRQAQTTTMEESESEEVIRPTAHTSRTRGVIEDDEEIVPVRVSRARRAISDDSDANETEPVLVPEITAATPTTCRNVNQNINQRSQNNRQESQSSEPESEEYIRETVVESTTQLGMDEINGSSSSSSSNTAMDDDDDAEEHYDDGNTSSDISYTPGEELRLPTTRSRRRGKLVRGEPRRRSIRRKQRRVANSEDGGINLRPRKRPRNDDIEEDNDEAVNINNNCSNISLTPDHPINNSSVPSSSSSGSHQLNEFVRSRHVSDSSSLSTIPCTSAAIATRFETSNNNELQSSESVTESLESLSSRNTRPIKKIVHEDSDSNIRIKKKLKLDKSDDEDWKPSTSNLHLVKEDSWSQSTSSDNNSDVSFASGINSHSDFSITSEVNHVVSSALVSTKRKATTTTSVKRKKVKQRRSTVKLKKKSRKRKNTRRRKKRRSSQNDYYQNDRNNNNSITSQFLHGLSLHGRERRLPFVNDDDEEREVTPSNNGDKETNLSRVTSSSNILDRISNDQKSLFNMKFSNISRLDDGTVLHNKCELPNVITSSLHTPQTNNSPITSLTPLSSKHYNQTFDSNQITLKSTNHKYPPQTTNNPGSLVCKIQKTPKGNSQINYYKCYLPNSASSSCRDNLKNISNAVESTSTSSPDNCKTISNHGSSNNTSSSSIICKPKKSNYLVSDIPLPLSSSQSNSHLTTSSVSSINPRSKQDKHHHTTITQPVNNKTNYRQTIDKPQPSSSSNSHNLLTALSSTTSTASSSISALLAKSDNNDKLKKTITKIVDKCILNMPKFRRLSTKYQTEARERIILKVSQKQKSDKPLNEDKVKNFVSSYMDYFTKSK